MFAVPLTWSRQAVAALLGLFAVFSPFQDTLAQPVRAEQNAAAPRVMTVEAQRGPGQYHVSPDKPIPAPAHPPIHTIPSYMPGNPDERQPLPDQGPGAIITYDQSTGKVQVGPKRKALNLGGMGRKEGFGGADGGGPDSFPEHRMSGPMAVVGNMYDSPWRMNVKILARFVDSSGNDRYSQSSGSMIDAETVLTAGHCIYDRQNNWGWAREVWVYPGWDGQGALGETINHYGLGRSTRLYSNTSWTDAGDFNYDLGVIEISRGVGMITGWYGLSYGGDCSWHTGSTYNNASYPAQGPCHDGTKMYYWSGRFDGCTGNRFRLDTTDGCTTAIFGGQSGSSAYYIENGSRYISAVTSTSDRSTVAYYARVWQQLSDWVFNEYIPTARGSAFDLQALEMRGSQSTVQAGSSLSGLTHLATNPSNGSATKNFSMGVYLSTNNNISTSDTLLSQQSVGATIGAMSSLRLSMAPVSIPANTPPGSYYVGVVYDTSTDGTTSNNATHTWDAFRITVTSPPPPSPPVITSPSTAIGTVGSFFSYSIIATNSPTSYNAVNLPPGLAVNPNAGTISGTPTQAGNWGVTISATNAGGTGTASLALTIKTAAPPAPVINSPLSVTSAVGVAFEYFITATSSPTSYNATNLPPGLSVNTATGRISGTPTTVGSWNVSISATNAGGTGSAVLSVSFYSLPLSPPVINSSLFANGTVGDFFSYTITAANAPTSFNATNLPAGLTVNTSTGEISGTPTLASLWHVTISASNNDGTDSEVLEVNIGNAPPPPCDCILECLLQANLNAGKQAAEKLLPLIEIPFPLKSLLTSMRGFRDNVLKTTPDGQRLVEAYYTHSNDLWRAILNRPELIPEIVQLVTELQPALSAADVTGTAMIAPNQWDRGEKLLSRLRDAATPELRAELDHLHRFLQDRRELRDGQVLVQLRPAGDPVAVSATRPSSRSRLLLMLLSTFIFAAVALPIRRQRVTPATTSADAVR